MPLIYTPRGKAREYAPLALNLIMKSFSPDDCRILGKVMNGNAGINVEKIDLIVKHLNLIKKAMLDNASRQEVAGLAQEAMLPEVASG